MVATQRVALNKKIQHAVFLQNFKDTSFPRRAFHQGYLKTHGKCLFNV